MRRLRKQYEGASRLRSHDTPERILLSEEIALTIRSTIDELPENLRVAIVLRDLTE